MISDAFRSIGNQGCELKLSTAGVRVGLWPIPVSDGLLGVSRAVGLPHVSHGGLRRVFPDLPGARACARIFRQRGASQSTVPRLTCVSRSSAASPWVACILQSPRGRASGAFISRLPRPLHRLKRRGA